MPATVLLALTVSGSRRCCRSVMGGHAVGGEVCIVAVSGLDVRTPTYEQRYGIYEALSNAPWTTKAMADSALPRICHGEFVTVVLTVQVRIVCPGCVGDLRRPARVGPVGDEHADALSTLNQFLCFKDQHGTTDGAVADLIPQYELGCGRAAAHQVATVQIGS